MSEKYDPTVVPTTHLIVINDNCYKSINGKCYSGGDKLWVPADVAEVIINTKNVERPVGRCLAVRKEEDALADPVGDRWGDDGQKPRRPRKPEVEDTTKESEPDAKEIVSERRRRRPNGQGAPNA